MTASPPPLLPDERLASGIARLALRCRGRFAAEAIQGLVTDSYERLAEHARVRTHLVVPAEHLAAERLDALAHIEGAPIADVRGIRDEIDAHITELPAFPPST
ncbi:hypothetical protein JCM4814A_09120 [Streptomyces phaeofaciens JCM 4814]|uniref:Protein-tyrosine-phosphatase-like N-terminal domain-containing protein n=1 Tax=Streptomyces phaeofaciens TaxID=68254 RepID=A0A918HPS8_9ACTN|nr:hypothetical protein [Streptomyces phaeofaciens]GGT91039.1 hypothetical protein GCM10010226_81450 [Streptomyces phaeofaciens]